MSATKKEKVQNSNREKRGQEEKDSKNEEIKKREGIISFFETMKWKLSKLHEGKKLYHQSKYHHNHSKGIKYEFESVLKAETPFCCNFLFGVSQDDLSENFRA